MSGSILDKVSGRGVYVAGNDSIDKVSGRGVYVAGNDRQGLWTRSLCGR